MSTSIACYLLYITTLIRSFLLSTILVLWSIHTHVLHSEAHTKFCQTASQAAIDAPGTTCMTSKEKKKRMIYQTMKGPKDDFQTQPTTVPSMDMTFHQTMTIAATTGANHNEAANITKILGGVTTNCFHHKR